MAMKGFYMSIGLCLALFSCSSGNDGENEVPVEPETPVVPEEGGTNENLPTIGKSLALFDYFSYQGQDACYEEQPLTGAGSFYNPILPGWYSDPSICTNGEGDYYLITSTFCYYPGVPIFHSRDLVNWTQLGHVLNRTSQLVNLKGQDVSGGIFAPAIAYNPHNKMYYMVTTNVGAGNFFVKTQDPAGEWSDPIYLPEVNGIDPSFFFDEDGKAYIVNNGDPLVSEYDGHKAVWIQEFDPATDKTVGERKIVVDKGAFPQDKPIWIEGPHMYKINGKYFIMAAEGGTGGWHSEVIFRSDSPMDGYVAWDKNPILTQRLLPADRKNPVTCAGHADLVQAKEGDWWAVFLGCRPLEGDYENLGRETFLMPVKWSDDGFPYMTQGNEEVPFVCSREGVTRKEKVTFGNFTEKDEFDTSSLGLQWLTLRAPAKENYSLSLTEGYLTLKCSDVHATEKDTPSYIGRRMQHHCFECVTRMLFDPQNEQEKAGVLLYKNETNHYFFFVHDQNGKRKVSLSRIESGQTEYKAQLSKEVDADAKEFWLKVVSKGSTYECYYSLTGEKDWQLLAKDLSAKSLSTSNAGGFTGTTVGMYAVK